MRMVISILFLALLIGHAQSQDKDPTPIHAVTTVPATARFEIVQSTLAAKFLFRLDRQTGLVYQIVVTKDGDLTWEEMEVLGLPAHPSAGVHYELFLSGLASKFIFLMNLDTGKTWQIQSSTDTKSKQISYAWIPLQ